MLAESNNFIRGERRELTKKKKKEGKKFERRKELGGMKLIERKRWSL